MGQNTSIVIHNPDLLRTKKGLNCVKNIQSIFEFEISQNESRVEKTKHRKTQQDSSGTIQKWKWKKTKQKFEPMAKEQNKN